MSDRVMRTRVVQSTETWQSVVQRGYDAFAATVGDENDGSEACLAGIAYLPAPDADHVWIVGSTGKGAGHAEMHALAQFVTNICGGRVDKFQDYARGDIAIYCEAKPCCRYCSSIMGLLGIRPWSKKTKKSPIRMGGTQWTTSMALRTFLSAFTAVPILTLGDIDSS
jgi:hypothetical protein